LIWLFPGFGVLYQLAFVFMLFQKFSDVDRFFRWLDPELIGQGPDLTNYAADCSFTPTNVWTRIDVFVIAHLFGWAMKAMVIRNMTLCWANSILWEVTEVAFAHLLTNFNECWWDIWILDILLCNGLGILLGTYLCRKLEMRDYNWASVKDLKRPRDKIRRAVLQFTPESWTHVRWFDPQSTYMRYIAISLFVLMWQISELNTFFLKHVFLIPTKHYLNTYRLVLIGTMAAPTIRQFYVYVTDKTCKRMGTHAWVFLAITFAESIVCIKFGRELFAQTIISQVVYWIAFQVRCKSIFCERLLCHYYVL
jgi:phosphatidylserine synthase 1